ncbi:MAG: helicase, partial [Gammaproteobacteria bacterium]|nr:helicase [Gammaproteobacteria bacterium]
VFGEPFEEESVITEDRLSAAEFFLGHEPEDFSLPSPEQTEKLIRLAGEDELAAYLAAALDAWLAEPLQQQDLLGDEARLELGRQLMQHAFLQDALALMGNTPWQAEELIEHLRRQYPDLINLRHPDAALEALFALVSHARIGQVGRLRPFLTVQVQLWLRELSRVVATVGNSQDIRFYVHNDLKEEEAAQALPVINCRDCGETGWVSAANERRCYRMDDLSTFYNLYFRPSDKSRVEMLYPYVEDGNPMPGFMKNRLCPKCLHLAVGDGVPTACRVCEHIETIPVLTPLQQDANNTGGSKQYACPFCGSPGGLSLIGVRSPTAISVSLSQLFASRFNDDKKTLSFSDNVQDAAHRAGFFNARTWRFGFRGAVQRYLMDGGEGLSLAEFQEGFWDYYQRHWSPERLVGNLIAPNLVWMRGYRDMLQNGKLGQGVQEVIKAVRQRAAYEILLEYGVSSRVGRTLEKSGASALAFDPAALRQAANRTRERALSELGAFHQTDEEAFMRMTLGVLRIIRQSGAFEDSAFDMYLKEEGKSYFLTNDFRKWLPGKSAGRNVPRFPYDNNGRDIKVFDRITGPKYTSWLKACTQELFIGEELFEGLSQILFAELYKAGFLVNLAQPHMGAIWGLDKQKVYVTGDVRQFVCDACQSVVPMAGQHADDWTGAPCPRRKCGGKLHPAEGAGLNYYNRLYSFGDLVRINAREHTGLLERPDREALEEDFKRSAGLEMPWMPNVLSCTPTLEMGIDIGDLSTVIMGSIPPGQAQYFQRSGRAGRKDGNALTMAVASTQAHDLYFYANPREMLEGEVSPPTVFLQASAVLERQFTAYCMDNWIRQGVPENAVPKNVGPCFNSVGKQNQNAFPQNLLHFVQNNLGSLFKGFVHLFQDQMDEQTQEELDHFAFGQGLGGSPMHIRVLEAFTTAKNQCDALSAGVREINKQIKILRARPQDISYEEQIKELDAEKKSLAEVIRSIKGKDVFNFLTDEGLLPNYAFPEAGITLKAVLRQSQDEDNEVVTGRRKRRNQVYEYSRAAASAISEFAPMNNFYVEGRKLSINQVDLASAKIEKWRLSPNCTHAAPQEMNTAVASCPRCGSPGWADAGQLRTMLKLSQVYSHDTDKDSLIGDDSDNRSHVFFTRQLLVDVDEEHDIHKAYSMHNEDFAFGYEYVKKATMREINFGESDIQGETLSVANMERVRKGFHICKHCGYLQHGNTPRHSYACKTKTMPTLLADAYEPCLFLYREFVTEALRILVPATTLD